MITLSIVDSNKNYKKDDIKPLEKGYEYPYIIRNDTKVKYRWYKSYNNVKDGDYTKELSEEVFRDMTSCLDDVNLKDLLNALLEKTAGYLKQNNAAVSCYKQVVSTLERDQMIQLLYGCVIGNFTYA